MILVIFQEELRHLFERIAVWSLPSTRVPALGSTTVDILVRTVADLAKDRCGALIVVVGKDPVERHIMGGIHSAIITTSHGLICVTGLFRAFSHVGIHDLAITKITAPRTVTLTAKRPVQTKQVKVELQNRRQRKNDGRITWRPFPNSNWPQTHTRLDNAPGT